MTRISASRPVLVLCALTFSWSGGGARGDDWSTARMAFRSPLTSIGVVQDLEAPADPDDPRIGGGFDAENYFQNVVIANVSACVGHVLQVFTTWSNAQSLSVAKSTLTATSALAFVPVATPSGVLQLDYRFHADTKRSRVTLFYFSNDGAKHEPAALQAMLGQYKVAALQDDLRAAVACR